MVKKIALSLILALLLWSLALPVFAENGKLLFGESLTLKRGETFYGDVVIFVGDLILEEESILRGNAAVFGGRARVAGTIEGDLAVFGGNVKIKGTGKIEGDVVIAGGRLEREEGAVIEGEVAEVNGLKWLTRPFPLPLPEPSYPRIEDLISWIAGRSIRFFVTLVALLAASVLIISLWPEQVKTVAETLVRAPLESGGIGLAAIVLGIPVGLVLLIFACLGLVVWLGLLIVGLFGLAALAYELGSRVLERAGVKELSPIYKVLLGVTLVQLLGLIPCLGSLLQVVVYSLGVGAVILSRFGTYTAFPERVKAIVEGEQ